MSAPPLFPNFGKNSNDFFKKKFDLEPVTLKNIRKATNGITVESGAVSVASSEKKGKVKPAFLRGYTKLTLGGQKWGSADVEVHTDAEQISKLSAKLTQLYPGVTLNLALASLDKNKWIKSKNPPNVPSAELTYSRDNLQAQATFKAAGISTTEQADLALSLGYENWSVGGTLSLDSDKVLSEVKDVHFGGQYTQSDLTASVYTSFTDEEVPQRQVNLSYYQKVNKDILATAIVTIEADSRKTTAQVGGEVRLDVDTTVRGKVEIPKAVATLNVEHRLSSPSALVGITSQFDVSNIQQPVAGKFGLSFTFGDF